MLNMKVQVWRGLTWLLKVKGCGGDSDSGGSGGSGSGGMIGNVVIVK